MGRRVTLRHVLVVIVLMLCGVGVAIAALGQSAATEVPIEAAPEAVASPPQPSPTPMVRVHVAGAVATPGVVTLPAGAIVQDAVLAAGGLLPDADPALLNLAAPVGDGMQIAIGTQSEPLGELTGTSPSAGGGGAPGTIDLNTADAGALESLPGVGPVMAQAILAWREEHGRFTSVEELQEIDGVGPKTFEKLRPLVRVS